MKRTEQIRTVSVNATRNDYIIYPSVQKYGVYVHWAQQQGIPHYFAETIRQYLALNVGFQWKKNASVPPRSGSDGNGVRNKRSDIKGETSTQRKCSNWNKSSHYIHILHKLCFLFLWHKELVVRSFRLIMRILCTSDASKHSNWISSLKEIAMRLIWYVNYHRIVDH